MRSWHIFFSSLGGCFHVFTFYTVCGSAPCSSLHLSLSVVTRFVEPIDRTSYKQWSSASPPVTQTEQETPSGSDSDLSNNQVAQTSAESEVSQLSFAEVMRLVQEGKEVPGAKQLDIKPCNQSATPSQMERRLKPWETSASSSK